MQHARQHSHQRTSVRVAAAPATSHEVALLFVAVLGLLLIDLLLL